MKRIISYATGLLLVSGLAGCDKFLEESSQNEVRPVSTDDLRELMVGEVYPQGTTFHNYLEMLTDDVDSFFTNASPGQSEFGVPRWVPVYTWDRDMYELLPTTGVNGVNGSRIDTYEHYYKRIQGCNVILDMIDRGVGGNEADEFNLRGQALGMRAWLYFMLVNLYAQPYNAEGIDVERAPGVVVLLSGVVEDLHPARASIADVYRRIEADLLEALPLVQRYGRNNNKYRVTDMFVYTLLSRMYLYQENWEEAARYATLGLEKNPDLLNFCDNATDTGAGQLMEGLYGLNSPEAIWWGYGYDSSMQPRGEYMAMDVQLFAACRSYTVSASLKALYEPQVSLQDQRDLRDNYFFLSAMSYPNGGSATTVGAKYSRNAASSSGTVKGMRVAELYLNRAEAYARMGGHTQDALDDLDFLRRHRYDTRNVAYTPLNITDPEQLIRFCYDERRREFAFEDHRWFDLRRQGMPEITHVIQLTAESAPATYTLEQGGDGYVLPIPRSALDINTSLVPNP